jgi:hypothetical protein
LELWKEGNRVFGLLLVYTGAPSDPPAGILEDVKFNPRSGNLSFSARLSTGLVYGRGYSGVASRDQFTFKGVLTRTQLTGTLMRSDELFPTDRLTSEPSAIATFRTVDAGHASTTRNVFRLENLGR